LEEVEERIHTLNLQVSEQKSRIYTLKREMEKEKKRLFTPYGRYTHTIQDFYAHTTWVELQLLEALGISGKRKEISKETLKIWDEQISTLKKLEERYKQNEKDWKEGDIIKFWAIADYGKVTHAMLDRDDPDRIMGKKSLEAITGRPVSGLKTIFDVARYLATKHTKWDYLRNFVKNTPNYQWYLKEVR